MIAVLFRHWSVASIPFVGRLSAIVTGWEYSHVGLWFPGDDVVYDASMRHDVARQPLATWAGGNPSKVIAVIIDSCDDMRIRQWLHVKMGSPYDWNAILLDKVFNVTRSQNPQWWFCSELIYEALRQGGCLQSSVAPHMVMPRDLFNMLTANTNTRYR